MKGFYKKYGDLILRYKDHCIEKGIYTPNSEEEIKTEDKEIEYDDGNLFGSMTKYKGGIVNGLFHGKGRK